MDLCVARDVMGCPYCPCPDMVSHVQDAAAEVRRVAAVVWTYDLRQLGNAWKQIDIN